MAKKRLVGRDGEFYSMIKGEVVTGDGSTSLKDGYYVATAIAEETGLPTGLKTGYVFKGGTAITPKEGDKVIPLELKKRCDIRNFSIEYNADEIDVTTLCDDEKQYRAGFVDASGSVDGITTIDVSEDIMNKFVPLVTQGAELANITISEIDNEPLLGKFDLNSQKAGGSAVLSYFAPVVLTSFSLGAQLDSEQTYTSNFRITPDDDIKPSVLKEIVAQ